MNIDKVLIGRGLAAIRRSSDCEVVLTRYLKAKLAEFNPHFPKDAYQDAVRQVVEFIGIQTLLATNRDKYSLMKGGVQGSFRNEKGERKKDGWASSISITHRKIISWLCANCGCVATFIAAEPRL